MIGSPNTINDYVRARNGKVPTKRTDDADLVSESSNIKRPRKENIEIPRDEFIENDTLINNVIKDEQLSKGEELSDTDSGVESEKKIPLEDPLSGSQGHDPESDDTDSWGTPSNSPAKGRTYANVPGFGGQICKY